MIYGWYQLLGAGLQVGTGHHFSRKTDGIFDVDDRDFMVELWLRTSVQVGNSGLQSKREAIGNSYGFEVYLLTGQKLSFYLKSRSGAAAISGQDLGITGLNDGQWHHVVIAFDRDGNAVGYKDGLAGSSPVDISSHDASANNAGDLLVGTRYNKDKFLVGDLSAPRIYDFGVDGLPGDLADLIKANFKDPGSVHADLLPHLLDSWQWDENPSLIGVNFHALIANPCAGRYGLPEYQGGKLAQDIADLLLYQFRNAANLKAFISAICAEVQDLNDEIRDVLLLRTLALAFGEQLDGIGEIVGEDRRGRNDEDYREAINLRILSNSSRGLPNNVIDACILLTKATEVVLIEQFPAKIELITNGPYIPDNLHEAIEAVAPVAVGVDSILATYGAEPMFYWQTESGSQEGLAFAELNIATGQLYWSGGKLSEAV